MPAEAQGVTLNGDEVSRVSTWVSDLAGRVDISGNGEASGSGSSTVDSAVNQAESWRRGATAIVVGDIATWGADLGDAGAVLAAADDAQAAAIDRAAATAAHRPQMV